MNIKKEVFWYTLKKPHITPLHTNLTTEVLIIGGGMGGLMAAHAWAARGKKVILIEKDFCGSGASGKSSGFISPDAEIELFNYIHLFGADAAKAWWNFGQRGVEAIRAAITTYNLECDYQEQDSLYIASNRDTVNRIKQEHQARQQLSYPSNFYDENTIVTIVNGEQFYAGVSYGQCFSITSYLFCQHFKEILQQNPAIEIYEATAAQQINNHTITTSTGHTITADYIIIAADYALDTLGYAVNSVYHAQTFLSVSKPLSDKALSALFPEKLYMAWDTELVFNYFRLTRENRLLIGTGDLLTTYWPSRIKPPNRIVRKIHEYCKQHFPAVPIQVDSIWAGLIGITKDFIPLAGQDPKNPHIYYFSAATGLPWAATLGIYSAEHMLDERTDMDQHISSERHFIINRYMQKVLTKPVAFALANAYAKFVE